MKDAGKRIMIDGRKRIVYEENGKYYTKSTDKYGIIKYTEVLKLSGLPGSDSKSNIGNAKSVVSSKIKELREKKKYYSDLASSLEKLADNIEYEEKSVVTDVRYIATEALELNRQSKWQAFCQWAYGTFCVDMLNWNPVTRFIGNGIKKVLIGFRKKELKLLTGSSMVK